MSASTRKDVAKAVVFLSEKHSGKRLSEMLAAYLVQNRRTGELDSIMREVMRQREAQDNITEVTATSAFRLNDATKKTISALLGGDRTIINEVIDPEMLGGVRLETSEKQLDLTVRNRLNRLKGVKV